MQVTNDACGSYTQKALERDKVELIAHKIGIFR